MTSACITLARTVSVHHHLQGKGRVFSSGHVAALGSGWCGVSKKEGENGFWISTQYVQENVINIPLILFECDPFE